MKETIAFLLGGVMFVLVLAYFIISDLIALLGGLFNTVFGFFMRTGMLALGIIGMVIIWKLLKRAWQEFKAVRQYLKKNREIEERMRQQAMRE